MIFHHSECFPHSFLTNVVQWKVVALGHQEILARPAPSLVRLATRALEDQNWRSPSTPIIVLVFTLLPMGSYAQMAQISPSMDTLWSVSGRWIGCPLTKDRTWKVILQQRQDPLNSTGTFLLVIQLCVWYNENAWELRNFLFLFFSSNA